MNSKSSELGSEKFLAHFLIQNEKSQYPEDI